MRVIGANVQHSLQFVNAGTKKQQQFRVIMYRPEQSPAPARKVFRVWRYGSRNLARSRADKWAWPADNLFRLIPEGCHELCQNTVEGCDRLGFQLASVIPRMALANSLVGLLGDRDPRVVRGDVEKAPWWNNEVGA
jgi:hypothetical protein